MSIHLEKDLPREGSLTGIIYKQLFGRPKRLTSGVFLAGTTAIVTGSNSGIGFEAARQLLQLGVHHLVLAVRSQSRGDAAAATLKQEHHKALIEVTILDMADYDSVKSFVHFCARLDYIDYVVLNAAQQSRTFQLCDNTGHERVFQVNYLSTAMLAWSLAPILKSKRRSRNVSDPPVLSVVGSDTMWLSRFKTPDQIFSYMDNPAHFNGFQRYMDSKLLIMLYVYQMSRLFDPEDVLINVCNPGLVGGTNLGRDAKRGWLTKNLLRLFTWMVSRSVEDGASNYIYALVAEGRKSHGSFVSDWDIKPYPRLVYTTEGKAVIERLWAETMEEFGRVGIDTSSP